MTGKTERVILVKGGSKKWYEQVIFIVNPKAPANMIPVDFVAEAEKIISEYNLKRENNMAKPPGQHWGKMPLPPTSNPLLVNENGTPYTPQVNHGKVPYPSHQPSLVEQDKVAKPLCTSQSETSFPADKKRPIKTLAINFLMVVACVVIAAVVAFGLLR